MRRYSDVHRRQLFYWLGNHIDYPDGGNKRTRLEERHRKQYIAALRGVLQQGKGLWMKAPRIPDTLGDDRNGFAVNRPITCFTEWLVGECLPHTTRYGRLGLGFSRQFVIQRGGHPLLYTKGTRQDVYTGNLIALHRFLHDEDQMKGCDPEELQQLRMRLDYLAHFVKRLNPPPSPEARAKHRKAVAKRKPKMDATEARYMRRFGKRLLYLEEREWRIVHHGGGAFGRYFKPGPGGPGRPEFYIPFAPGKDLFTLVLPDNETLNMVMNNKFFIKRLFSRDTPHVTVLSLEDIGTF